MEKATSRYIGIKLTLHLDINLKCFFNVPSLLKTELHYQLTTFATRDFVILEKFLVSA